MGKRTNFKKVARDFYPTPEAAVLPLLPHLPPGTTFDEPCAGAGHLIKHLAYFGHFCDSASDIAPPEEYNATPFDALNIPRCHGNMFITNPPYTWKVLSPMITHLSDMALTWLLLPADIMHNKRMAPHMKICRKIVSIGRVKWFGNQTGMENSAWYLFDAAHIGDTIFYGRTE